MLCYLEQKVNRSIRNVHIVSSMLVAFGLSMLNVGCEPAKSQRGRLPLRGFKQRPVRGLPLDRLKLTLVRVRPPVVVSNYRRPLSEERTKLHRHPRKSNRPVKVCIALQDRRVGSVTGCDASQYLSKQTIASLTTTLSLPVRPSRPCIAVGPC